MLEEFANKPASCREYAKIRHVCILLIYSGLRFSCAISTPFGKLFEGQKHCSKDHICMLLRGKVMQIGDQSDAV